MYPFFLPAQTGDTVLHIAAENGHVEVVRLLLAVHPPADVNKASKEVCHSVVVDRV